MSDPFNFFEQWYPLSPLEDLDPFRPTLVTLLELRLVIWKPPSGGYRVFLDQCPHRLAPLSEGRVDEDTGHLMCSYHGWQFDPEGVCQAIPQQDSSDRSLESQAKNLCVQSFPVQEANDLLWVWPSADTAELAHQTPLPLSPQIDASQGFVWQSMVRDLAYDWQTLLENVADPSHVPFAHHGIQGNRKRARPVPLKITHSDARKIEARVDSGLKSTITFEAPCRLEYAISFGTEGKQLGLITYCIPVAPGRSRIVAQFSRNFARGLSPFIPRWWDHLRNRNLVLEGDMILLHQQERYLQNHPSGEWKTAFKLPTSADRLVIEFRHWFDRYGKAQLPWGQDPLPPLTDNRRELLDRYQQHTVHCHSCRTALKRTQRLGMLTFIVGISCLSLTAVLPDPLRAHWGWLLMGLALLSFGCYGGLKGWLEPQFYFVDYVHPHRK